MKKLKYIFIFLIGFVSINSIAQERLLLPFKSPNSFVEQSIGLTKIQIGYSRPSLNEREIGKFVATYNRVWRLGANHNTTISFSKEVSIGENKIPQGTYSLFAVPRSDSWTLILNKNYSQWGAFTYQKKDELVRFDVSVEEDDYEDLLSISFDNVDDYSGDLIIRWGTIKIPVNITTETDLHVKQEAETALKAPFHWIIPGEFAAYSIRNNVYLEKGLSWAEQSVSMQEAPSNLQTLAEIQYKLKNFEDALEAINKAINLYKYAGNLAIKAKILASLRRFDEAITFAEEAIDLGQDNSVYFHELENMKGEILEWKSNID